MLRRLLISSLALCFFVFSLPAWAQDLPPQINNALADLSAKLARNITVADLEGYSYEQLNFPDARLGCALAPAPTNPATNINGFIFRLTVAGVEYDYRVSFDTRIVVPCSSTLQAITPPPTLIPTPTAATTVCPPNFAGYLPPQVRVGEEARVTAGAEPNRIRNAPSLAGTQTGMLNPGMTFMVIGGPSCADAFVWWEIQAGDQIGWMAEGALPDNYYIEPTGVRGSGMDFPEFAAISEDSLRFYQFDYFESLTESALVEMPPLGEYDRITSSAWSPDGSLFAFVLVQTENATSTYNLYVTSFNGEEPTLIADDIYDGLPISFTDDTSNPALLYAQAASEVFTSDDSSTLLGSAQRVSILSQTLAPAADAVIIGTVNYGVGCGGGGGSAAYTQYQSEAGYGAHAPILQATDYGIVFTTNCTGSGTALLDPQSGEWVSLGFNLSRVSVSPNRTQIVGIQDIQPGADPGTLARVDLQTGEASLISTIAAPSQVAWATDGLYFSRVVAGADANSSTVVLSRIGVDGAGETEVYSGVGYAIGRILTAPDGSVFFSVVPSDAEWEAAQAAGAVDADAGYRTWLRYAPVSLYYLRGDGDAVLLGDDLAQATLNSGAFTDVAAVG
jgi:hypothetical protein